MIFISPTYFFRINHSICEIVKLCHTHFPSFLNPPRVWAIHTIHTIPPYYYSYIHFQFINYTSTPRTTFDKEGERDSSSERQISLLLFNYYYYFPSFRHQDCWRRSVCHRGITTRAVDEHGILRHRLFSQVQVNIKREKKREREKEQSKAYIIFITLLSNSKSSAIYLVEIQILSIYLYLTSDKPISQGRQGNPGCRLLSYHYDH